MDWNVEQLEIAIKQHDYEKITKLVDIESAAQYYLLSEFTVNPDAYWTSFYFYKDGVDDMIHFGPAWDYDFALANRGWTNWLGERFYSPRETMIRKEEFQPKEFYDEMGLSSEQYEASLNISRLMFDMVKIPEFQDEIKRVYMDTMAGKKDELMQYVDSRSGMIEGAAIANETFWGRNKYLTETMSMKEWIGERYDYFEYEYGNGAQMEERVGI